MHNGGQTMSYQLKSLTKLPVQRRTDHVPLHFSSVSLQGALQPWETSGLLNGPGGESIIACLDMDV